MEKINKDDTILLNIVNMLTARGHFKEESIKSNYDKLLKQKSEEMIFKLKTELTGKTFNVMYVYGKLSTIKKIQGLDLFINNSKGENRIFIVDNVNQKAYKMFLELNNTEVFFDYELLINLIDHELQPKFIVLNKEEQEDFYKIWDVDKNDMAKMETTDPVARYYNLDAGNIIKIIRPSVSAGEGISYRYIKKAPTSNLFE